MDAVPLLLDFVNTVEVETATEFLGTPQELTAWLREHGLIEDAEADGALLAQAMELRTALRAAMLGHHETEDDPDPGLVSRALSPFPLRVAYGEGPTLLPALDGAAAGVARIAVAVVEAASAGTWARLKICPQETCQEAFYDTSKNRSRTWCSMQVCGNRTKTRAYRARQRAE
jgi:predicted RNA-binding Zn ribbon-like protein